MMGVQGTKPPGPSLSHNQKRPVLFGRNRLPVAVGDEFFRACDQRSIGDRVIERIEAAYQESRDAEIIIIQQRIGNLVHGADQRGAVSGGAGSRAIAVQSRLSCRSPREAAPSVLPPKFVVLHDGRRG